MKFRPDIHYIITYQDYDGIVYMDVARWGQYQNKFSTSFGKIIRQEKVIEIKELSSKQLVKILRK